MFKLGHQEVVLLTKKIEPGALDVSRQGGSAVDAFVREVGRLPAARAGSGRGRLLFAMDAPASREPTWDHACAIQGEMFVATDALVGAVRRELFSTAIPC